MKNNYFLSHFQNSNFFQVLKVQNKKTQKTKFFVRNKPDSTENFVFSKRL